MGNKLYSQNEPVLQNFELIKVKKFPLVKKRSKKERVKQLIFCPYNEFLYLILENNPLIYKYSMIEEVLPAIYTSHRDPVLFIDIDWENKSIYSCDSYVIRVHDTEHLKEKMVLEDYSKSGQSRIAMMKFFGVKYLIVFLEK